MPFEVKLNRKSTAGNAWTASIAGKTDAEKDLVDYLNQAYGDVPKRIILLNALGCFGEAMQDARLVDLVKAVLDD